MFKGPEKIVRDNKSSSYPVFELTGVNCINKIGLQIGSLWSICYFRVIMLNGHIVLSAFIST